MLSTLKMQGTIQVCHAQSTMMQLGEPQLLDERYAGEVLHFLGARPLSGLFLSGYIEDNGFDHRLNRGDFFGVRNWAGELEAVGLIGHATLFEAKTSASLAALASVAQTHEAIHMLLGPHDEVQQFWKSLSRNGRTAGNSCRELLFTKKEEAAYRGDIPALRAARPTDIDLLLPVHAEMARGESGVNPLEIDPEGFRSRYLRRIKRDRVWVLIQNDRLVFKADVALQTSDATYLEGIYVAPELRGRGCGKECLSALSEILLQRVSSVCLLVNEQNLAAHKMYRNAGFNFEEYYQSVFLQPPN